MCSRAHTQLYVSRVRQKKVKEKWTAEIDEEFRLSLIFNVSPSPGVRYRKWSYRRKEICVFVTRARELSGGRIFWSWTFSESLVWVYSQCVGGIYFSFALSSPISIHVYYVVKTQRYLSLLFELSSLPPQAQQQKFSSRTKPFLFHAWIFNTPVLCGKKQKKQEKEIVFRRWMSVEGRIWWVSVLCSLVCEGENLLLILLKEAWKLFVSKLPKKKASSK